MCEWSTSNVPIYPLILRAGSGYEIAVCIIAALSLSVVIYTAVHSCCIQSRRRRRNCGYGVDEESGHHCGQQIHEGEQYTFEELRWRRFDTRRRNWGETEAFN